MKNELKVSCCVLLSLLPLATLPSQKMQSDNGDGIYTNPVIYSDFPDPDVIRVDSTYYMVSTTMFIFPEVIILKSYDPVNWEYCSIHFSVLAFMLSPTWTSQNRKVEWRFTQCNSDRVPNPVRVTSSNGYNRH